jgi:APA family basic amino acid/polyamine antiporter
VNVNSAEVPPGRAASTELFSRKSSGLIREAGLFDTVFYNWVAAGAVGLALVYNVYWALNAFPGVDLINATLLTVPFAVCAVLVFGLLAAAIPRSGGDYVFVSRVIHPIWGFLSSWMGFVSVVAYAGWVAWFTAVAFVPAALGVMAQSTNNSSLLDLSTWAAGRSGSLVVGAVLLVAAAALMIAGLKVALRAITVLAILGLGGLLLSAISLLANSRADFVAQFNAFANPIMGGENAYQEIIRLGAESGLPSVASGSASFAAATLPAVVISFYAIGYAVWSIYFAGEFKGARDRNRQLRSMGIPTVLNLFVFVSMFALMFNTVGYEFINASSFLYNYVPDQYPLPVPPFAPFFAALLSDNFILNFVIALAWLAWPIAMLFLIMVGFSRVIFAWSFDGVMPGWLAEVHPRMHTPVKAILTAAFLTLIALVLLVQVEAFLTFLAYTVVLALFFWGSTALAGILLPYRLPDVYESSSAKWEIAGVPVVTVAGVLLLGFVVFEFIAFFAYAGLGILNRGQALWVILAVLAIGALIFALSYATKRSRGVDLMLVYREIPPE